MKRKIYQSLRFDLVFDLSLLTFCALILSQGLLIVLLRSEFPKDLRGVAHGFLTSLHRQALTNKSFREALSSENPTEIEQTFNLFLAEMDLGSRWSLVNVNTLPDDVSLPVEGRIEPIEQHFLFVVPTVVGFKYITPSPHKGVLQYEWSLEVIQGALTGFKYRAFFITLFIEAILVIMGYFLLFRRNLLVPINNLADVSKAFLQENWDARCIVERRDELGDVGEALNEMAGKIQEKEKKLVLSIESLKRANEELEVAQNEQLQIEKLASIGRLAAGVAHEVGNPLGAISGYIDILRRSMTKLGSSAEDIEICDRIENETNRISKIIRALLHQARPPKDRIQGVKLKGILVRSVQLAQIPSAIEIDYEFEDDEAEVLAEEDQLVQIFLNLLVNARHAIDAKKDKTEKGRLKVRVVSRKLPIYRHQSADPNEFDTSVVRSLKPETYWVTSIEDNGIGISEADQKKLFEPFFSTKAPGKGTGLGLYVTKSIVESFRGAIVVRSALNYGASFAIFLPKAKVGAFQITS